MKLSKEQEAFKKAYLKGKKNITVEIWSNSKETAFAIKKKGASRMSATTKSGARYTKKIASFKALIGNKVDYETELTVYLRSLFAE